MLGEHERVGHGEAHGPERHHLLLPHRPFLRQGAVHQSRLGRQPSRRRFPLRHRTRWHFPLETPRPIGEEKEGKEVLRRWRFRHQPPLGHLRRRLRIGARAEQGLLPRHGRRRRVRAAAGRHARAIHRAVRGHSPDRGVRDGEPAGAGARRNSVLHQGGARRRWEGARDCDPVQRGRAQRRGFGAVCSSRQEEGDQRAEIKVEFQGEPDHLRRRFDGGRDVGRARMVVLRILPLRPIHVPAAEREGEPTVAGRRLGAGDLWLLPLDPGLQKPMKQINAQSCKLLSRYRIALQSSTLYMLFHLLKRR